MIGTISTILVSVVLLASLVNAQTQTEVLLDILVAKGVISQSEALQARGGAGGGAPYDQRALIGLLRAKGILDEQDLARLSPPAVSPDPRVQDVTERLSRLEAQQQDLLARTAAQAEQQTRAIADVKKAAVADVKKSIDWLNRFTLFGDIRVRHEGFYQERVRTRNRERFRLRVGARLKVSEELEGGLRLVSGDPNEIISNNQTMTDVFTRKPVAIDNAYITVRPGKTVGLAKPFFSLTAGKFNVHFFRPRAVMTSELVYDSDLTPEGTAQEVTVYEGKGWVRGVTLLAGQWVAKEFSAGPDSFMLGEQLQVALAPTPAARLTLAVADYYFLNAEFIAQERNRNSSLALTNSVVLRDGTVVRGGDLIVPNPQNPIERFAGGFHVINPSLQLTVDTGYPRWPFSLTLDYAHNLRAKFGEDSAYRAEVGVGRTRDPGDWAFALAWQRVETDAVVSMFTTSDYGRRGGTNVQGPVVEIDYLLMPRLTLTARGYFVNFIDRPEGQRNSTVSRLQLDALFAF